MALPLLRPQAQTPAASASQQSQAAGGRRRAARHSPRGCWGRTDLCLMSVRRLLPPHNERTADRPAGPPLLSPMSSPHTERVARAACEALWELESSSNLESSRLLSRCQVARSSRGKWARREPKVVGAVGRASCGWPGAGDERSNSHRGPSGEFCFCFGAVNNHVMAPEGSSIPRPCPKIMQP